MNWQPINECPLDEQWCVIAYRWKGVKDTGLRYVVDKTIPGKGRWWGHDPERGSFELVAFMVIEPLKPSHPAYVEPANPNR